MDDLEVVESLEICPHLGTRIEGLHQVPITAPELEVLPPQPAVGQRPVYAPSRFIFSSVLRDSLVQLLGLVGGAPFDSAQSIDQSGTEVGPYPIVVTSRAEVPPTSVVTQPVVSQTCSN